MKLRNKKTGEIKALDEVMREAYKWNNYNSLAELNAEWEDYEETKKYWYISDGGDVYCFSDYYVGSEIEEAYRKIGNLFETREEAEKAVEKLKAWKQMKDNCNFRFNGVERDEMGRLIAVKVKFDKAQVSFDTAKRCYEILGLLFGGEK